MKRQKTHKEIMKEYYQKREIRAGIVIALVIFLLFAMVFG
jgi:ABC-type multidrug transport system permease subunit